MASPNSADEVHAMYPPSQSMNLSIEAISGITGSVSIACWVVVFSPQIIENFRRGSGDGLSLTFLALWLAGDVFNVLGAWLQGVLPTMVILAVYYTFADIILLWQCLYYRRVNAAKHEAPLLATGDGNGPITSTFLEDEDINEEAPLLSRSDSYHRKRSLSEQAHHLSPATPFIEPEYLPSGRKPSIGAPDGSAIEALRAQERKSRPAVGVWRTLVFNTVAVAMVVGAGIGGWFLSNSHPKHHSKHSHGDEALEYNTLGQVFGYLCAVLYLGSRLPQIILNFKRKSCEGVSLLFFLFACLGNTTYVISILAYEPRKGAGQGYGRYLGVNASWLAGSLGTLGLDFIIFAQFFLYGSDDHDFSDDEADEDAEVIRSP